MGQNVGAYLITIFFSHWKLEKAEKTKRNTIQLHLHYPNKIKNKPIKALKATENIQFENGSFIDDQLLQFELKPCTGRNRSQTCWPTATTELE